MKQKLTLLALFVSFVSTSFSIGNVFSNTIKKRIGLPVVHTGISSKNVNNFSFIKVSCEDEIKSMEIIESFFCEEVESKYRYLISIYTREVPLDHEGCLVKIVVDKPVIYTAIIRLHQYYIEECRKGTFNQKEAELQFGHVLDVGLSVLNINSEIFEKTIKSKNDLEELTNLFQAVELTF